MLNVFRFTGDTVHLLSFLILIIFMWRKKSCEGISGKTQILFAFVFTFRYLDLFYWTVSLYNTSLKIAYLLLTYFTLFSIYYQFRNKDNRAKDSFRAEILIIISAGMALIKNYEFNMLEVSWAFSEYLEIVAIVPQVYMTVKHCLYVPCVWYYILMLGVYRLMYVLNWIYKYNTSGVFDIISVVSGCSETLILFISLFLVYLTRKKTKSPTIDNSPKLRIQLVAPGRGYRVVKQEDENISKQKEIPPDVSHLQKTDQTQNSDDKLPLVLPMLDNVIV